LDETYHDPRFRMCCWKGSKCLEQLNKDTMLLESKKNELMKKKQLCSNNDDRIAKMKCQLKAEAEWIQLHRSFGRL